MGNEIKLVIVEDTAVIRDAITMLVTNTAGYTCVGVFENGEDAAHNIPALHPDIVLMDIGLPGMSGIDCIREIKEKTPGTQYLVCSIFKDDENVFEALKAGANGYVVKNTKPALLLEAITDLHNGGSPMSPQIARKVIKLMQQPKVNTALALLTTKEAEVLTLLSKGFRYKEIADQLNISHGTVRSHIYNIYQKLQVQSRTDALNKVFPR